MSSTESPQLKKAQDDNVDDLNAATSRLAISNPIIANTPTTPIEILEEGGEDNPWTEQAEAAHQPIHRLATPDPIALECALATGDAKSPSPPRTPHKTSSADAPRVSGEILREFDPLADTQEKDAQEAWATTEGHPPPTNGAPSWLSDAVGSAGRFDTEPGTPQNQTGHVRAQSASSGLNFTSLASLARTVQASVSGTVAGLASRPRSMETNPSILSPTAISTFVAQGGEWPRTDSRPESRAGRNVWGGVESGVGGESSPQRSEDSGSGAQFDFPKFLEQMKSKSAEPVAKYLRSYVVPMIVRVHCFDINPRRQISE